MFFDVNTAPKDSTFEYYGWGWAGIKIVRLYFKDTTMETVSLTLFNRIDLSRTKWYKL